MSTATRTVVHAHPKSAQLRSCIACGCLFSRRPLSSVHWLLQCTACGLGWVDPQPNDEELAGIYNESYYRGFGYYEETAGSYHTSRCAAFKYVLRQTHRYLTPGSLLDVGSGLGHMVLAAHELGFDASGVEANPEAWRVAQQIVPGRTALASFECFTSRRNFHVITFMDVFEHLRNPLASLQHAWDLLEPDGVVLIVCPKFDSSSAAVLGSRWPHLHRDHLWYYSQTSLRHLLYIADFEVLTVATAWKRFSVGYFLSVLASAGGGREVSKLAGGVSKSFIGSTHLPALPAGYLVVARKRAK
jgi:SAM-dependent methyltransferase